MSCLSMMHKFTFTSKIYLPILKKEIRYESLINYHYFNILKFITNNDDEGLNFYFENIIKNSITEPNYYSELTNLEKFLILLDMRSTSVGDNLQLNGSNSAKIDISLNAIKNSILNKFKDIELSKIVSDNNFKFYLSIPKNFFVEDIDQLYKEIIDKIEVNDEVLHYFSLTDQEKEDIINCIPATVSGDMLNYIRDTQEIVKSINIITGNSKFGLETIILSVFDKTMFYFLKSIFTDDLYNYYDLQYNLSNKMNVSYDHFMKMSPNECKLFINFYNKDISKQEEAQSKQQGSYPKPTMPSMPSMPKFR